MLSSGNLGFKNSSKTHHRLLLQRKCDSNEDCPICLEMFDNLNNTHVLKCGHRFHNECISIFCAGDRKIYKKRYKRLKMNILGHGNCPMCREPINEIIFFKNTKKNLI